MSNAAKVKSMEGVLALSMELDHATSSSLQIDDLTVCEREGERVCVCE